MANNTLNRLALLQNGFRLNSGEHINNITNYVLNSGSIIATADSGTTQTLTAAMIASDAAGMVYHRTTGGSTPSLTLPLASAIIANLPNWIIGGSYTLRIINTNSGTATVVTNTGITTTGTLTIATNTWRDFVVTYSALNAVTVVSVGTGTES